MANRTISHSARVEDRNGELVAHVFSCQQICKDVFWAAEVALVKGSQPDSQPQHREYGNADPFTAMHFETGYARYGANVCLGSYGN